MTLKIEKTPLESLLLFQPRSYHDERGYLAESFRKDLYREAGVTCEFVQDNTSYSVKGVLRGLHAQIKKPQAKLVRAASGEIFDVAMDARPGSPTFGKWHGDILSGRNHKQLFIPTGFLHGFVVLSESATVHYKCSEFYDPTESFGVKWDDPDLAIEWPVANPIVSAKDQNNLAWREAVKIINEQLGRV